MSNPGENALESNSKVWTEAAPLPPNPATQCLLVENPPRYSKTAILQHLLVLPNEIRGGEARSAQPPSQPPTSPYTVPCNDAPPWCTRIGLLHVRWSPD